MNRSKNAKRNIVFGIILKIYQIFVPFILRTVMIYYLGIEYVGLNSLFYSILQVLNLAELGVGSAMVFSMYHPIATSDSDTICALMNLYRKYYRIIGLVVLVIGISITPFLPILIKGSVPGELNLYVLYFLNLGATVVSYWLFAYQNSILLAHQRTDVSSKVGIVVSTIEYLLQFAVLILFRSYYLFLVIKIATQILGNVLTAFFARKLFPQYVPKGQVDNKTNRIINSRIRDLFTAKLGGIVINSVDSIVISAFLGLTILAIYNNYYYIITALTGFMAIVFSSCLAGIGNSIVTETKEKNYRDFKTFTLIIAWISGICCCCLICLYQPFMMLWLKDESLVFGLKESICFGIYFYVYEVAAVMINYKDAAGIWSEDKFRPLTTALFNLFLNIVLVQYIGVLGILLSTIISYLIVGIPWLIHTIFKKVFLSNPLPYVKKLFIYFITTGVVSVICYLICELYDFSGWISIVIRLITCFVISNVFFLFVYSHTEEFEEAKEVVTKMVGFRSR